VSGVERDGAPRENERAHHLVLLVCAQHTSTPAVGSSFVDPPPPHVMAAHTSGHKFHKELVETAVRPLVEHALHLEGQKAHLPFFPKCPVPRSSSTTSIQRSNSPDLHFDTCIHAVSARFAPLERVSWPLTSPLVPSRSASPPSRSRTPKRTAVPTVRCSLVLRVR